MRGRLTAALQQRRPSRCSSSYRTPVTTENPTRIGAIASRGSVTSHRVTGTLHRDAFTIARMPALIGSGSVDHASSTARNSASATIGDRVEHLANQIIEFAALLAIVDEKKLAPGIDHNKGTTDRAAHKLVTCLETMRVAKETFYEELSKRWQQIEPAPMGREWN